MTHLNIIVFMAAALNFLLLNKIYKEIKYRRKQKYIRH